MKILSDFTPVGLGTWMIERSPEAAMRALRVGLEEGANHIDTAEMYGDGKAEEIVSHVITGLRDKIYLVSKVLPSNAGYDKTLAACERSLRRLGTDYLDVYLLHWRDKRTPLEETFRAFEKLKQDGKIRAWGVSNFDVADMEEALRLKAEPACNQVYYSLEERAIEVKLLPWCWARSIPIVAYSPLGQGRMPDHKILKDIAVELNATPAQIALAFLLHNKGVIAIPKSSDVQHTRDNVRAMHIKLTPAHMRRLSEAFPAKARRGLPMV